MLNISKWVPGSADSVRFRPRAPTRAAAGAPVAADAGKDPVAWVEDRVLSLLRCVLALSALGIVAVHPEPGAMNEGVRLLPIVSYWIYSLAVLLGGRDRDYTGRWVHWLDALVYGWLLLVTPGSGIPLFHFFLFAIFVGALAQGYAEGLRVTIAAVGCLAVAAAGPLQPGVPAINDGALLHAAYLGVLGFMISCVGGSVSKLRGRLQVLHEINNVWNPRFGVAHTLALNLDRIVRFFGADSALLLLKPDASDETYAMHIATPRTAGSPPSRNVLGESAARPFLELRDGDIVRHTSPGLVSRAARRLLALPMRVRTAEEAREAACERLANVLDAHSFMSVPYVETAGVRGRLFVTSMQREFGRSDVESLRQIADAVAMVLENSRLMEQLITSASEHERFKVSRDLHDSTIQPYIGLKIGLQALFREATGAESSLTPRIRDLIDMTAEAIGDLRRYAANLREGNALHRGGLLDALSDQVERYRRFFGIEFELDVRLTREITGPLAAELFHFLVEGMSNVLKHTQSKKGWLHLSSDATHVRVQVGNENPRPGTLAPFRPRSIAERVESLGGELEVDLDRQGHTIVTATIPA
jgi:signal transduction histidine kinase